MNRRRFLKGVACSGLLAAPAFAQTQSAAGPYTLAPLPYANDALEPHIDAQTMMIHHDRHHAAYVANANAAAQKWPDMAKLPIEAILKDLKQAPDEVRAAVRNNLGGHWNHTFFWDIMTPGGAKEPSGDLKSAIEAAGGLPGLIDKVNSAGVSRFGSGWTWLVADKDRKLNVISTSNQDTPLELGVTPVLGIDVWEHAYYLKYQNRRADYLKGWWNVVNWDKAAANLRKAG